METEQRLPRGWRWGRFKIFNYTWPELYGGSYFKNMSTESPELVSAVMVLAGFSLITYYDDKTTKIMTERPYKHFYTVVRPGIA